MCSHDLSCKLPVVQNGYFFIHPWATRGQMALDIESHYPETFTHSLIRAAGGWGTIATALWLPSCRPISKRRRPRLTDSRHLHSWPHQWFSKWIGWQQIVLNILPMPPRRAVAVVYVTVASWLSMFSYSACLYPFSLTVAPCKKKSQSKNPFL